MQSCILFLPSWNKSLFSLSASVTSHHSVFRTHLHSGHHFSLHGFLFIKLSQKYTFVYPFVIHFAKYLVMFQVLKFASLKKEKKARSRSLLEVVVILYSLHSEYRHRQWSLHFAAHLNDLSWLLISSFCCHYRALLIYFFSVWWDVYIGTLEGNRRTLRKLYKTQAGGA